jgi:hypothetical protein
MTLLLSTTTTSTLARTFALILLPTSKPRATSAPSELRAPDELLSRPFLLPHLLACREHPHSTPLDHLQHDEQLEPVPVPVDYPKVAASSLCVPIFPSPTKTPADHRRVGGSEWCRLAALPNVVGQGKQQYELEHLLGSKPRRDGRCVCCFNTTAS